MAGCPNRCKHCYLGYGVNMPINEESVRTISLMFKKYQLSDENIPYFNHVTVQTYFREPDYLNDYKYLWKLENELSTKNDAIRFELLSMWRLANDNEYAKWAYQIGVRRCQISFFGMEETTNYFFNRNIKDKNAFKDNIIATERLLDAGIIPRWQIFLNKKGIGELDELMSIVDKLNLEKRVLELGEEFTIFTHIPDPLGAAFEIEKYRLDHDDIYKIPKYLIEKSKIHFGINSTDDFIGKTEKEWLPTLIVNDNPINYSPPPAFFIDGTLDVYTNTFDMSKAFLMSNVFKDGIDCIMDNYLYNRTIGLKANKEIPISYLAGIYGNKNGEKLYVKESLLDLYFSKYLRSLEI